MTHYVPHWHDTFLRDWGFVPECELPPRRAARGQRLFPPARPNPNKAAPNKNLPRCESAECVSAASEQTGFGRHAHRSRQWVLDNDPAYVARCLRDAAIIRGGNACCSAGSSKSAEIQARMRFLDFLRGRGKWPEGDAHAVLVTTSQRAEQVWEALKSGIYTNGVEKVVDRRGSAQVQHLQPTKCSCIG